MKFLNIKLAVVALILASLALIVGNPKERSHTVVDIKKLATTIEREEDHITADELADELMRPSTRWRIIDLRDSAAYLQYHIPNAERKALSQLVDEQLSQTDTIILYSDGGLHAIQAWMLLAAQGYRNIFSLRGGLNEWNTTIRFPVVSDTLAQEERNSLSARAKFFGGELRLEEAALSPQKQITPQKKKEQPVKKLKKIDEGLRYEC
ncbi:MAG: rhodanese-like domain-containing protein [Bacteroidetes bacterium]|nr:MAG: rhodanese-like domain-containing protein [Bacteroidota bacterium]